MWAHPCHCKLAASGMCGYNTIFQNIQQFCFLLVSFSQHLSLSSYLPLSCIGRYSVHLLKDNSLRDLPSHILYYSFAFIYHSALYSSNYDSIYLSLPPNGCLFAFSLVNARLETFFYRHIFFIMNGSHIVLFSNPISYFSHHIHCLFVITSL